MTFRSHTWPLLLSGLFFWVFGAITINITSESLAPIILSLIAVFSAYQSYKARDAGQKVAQVAVKVEAVKVAAESTAGTLEGLKTTADATHVLVNSANASLLMEIANLKAQIALMNHVREENPT